MVAKFQSTGMMKLIVLFTLFYLANSKPVNKDYSNWKSKVMNLALRKMEKYNILKGHIEFKIFIDEYDHKTGPLTSEKPWTGGFASNKPHFGPTTSWNPWMGGFTSNKPHFGPTTSWKPWNGGFTSNKPHFGPTTSWNPWMGGFTSNKPHFGPTTSWKPWNGGFTSNKPPFGPTTSWKPWNSGLTSNKPHSGLTTSHKFATGASMQLEDGKKRQTYDESIMKIDTEAIENIFKDMEKQ